jgi:hypothetical protein
MLIFISDSDLVSDILYGEQFETIELCAKYLDENLSDEIKYEVFEDYCVSSTFDFIVQYCCISKHCGYVFHQKQWHTVQANLGNFDMVKPSTFDWRAL